MSSSYDYLVPDTSLDSNESFGWSSYQDDVNVASADLDVEVTQKVEQAKKRGRGRPKGSKVRHSLALSRRSCARFKLERLILLALIECNPRQG